MYWKRSANKLYMKKKTLSRKRLKVSQVEKALRDSKGFVSQAASALGVSRTTLYVYINDSPTLQRVLEEEREASKDFAESKLLKNIEEGKETSLIFFLKTQAADRGYVDKQKVEVLVRNELEAALDALQEGLTIEEYERVLYVLSRGDSPEAAKLLTIEAGEG